jgi:uncharacterized membrane protein YjjP (DUF1212 family)
MTVSLGAHHPTSSPESDLVATWDTLCELVLSAVRLLYVNGQGTEQVLTAAQSVARALGLRANLSLRWGEVAVQIEEGDRPIYRAAANPAGVDMNRVIAGMRIVEDIKAGRLGPEAAANEIAGLSRSPAVATWLFALASGAGAMAMAVIFGVQHIGDALMIFISAFAGGYLRRGLARLSTNALAQPFCASLFAGVFAAAAFGFELIASLRFVALCPCVILVPGAHVLNGLADLINGRLHLGGARLIHAALIVVAITTGLLFGLVLCGAALPLTETVRAVPLWQHMLAGGVAVAAFGVLFSMPLRVLPLPMLVGALAQALRWSALTQGFGAGAAALVACLLIGTILIPIARTQRLPFAAIGFISVVSMIPGSYLFTMAAGLVQIAEGDSTTLDLIAGTLTSGTTALLITLAISLGLVIPKLVFETIEDAQHARKAL